MGMGPFPPRVSRKNYLCGNLALRTAHPARGYMKSRGIPLCPTHLSRSLINSDQQHGRVARTHPAPTTLTCSLLRSRSLVRSLLSGAFD